MMKSVVKCNFSPGRVLGGGVLLIRRIQGRAAGQGNIFLASLS